MAPKKRSKKKLTKSKRTAGRKPTAMKTVKRPKKLAKRKTVPNRLAKAKASSKKTVKKPQRLAAQTFSPEGLESRSGQQAGDLQGLSRLPAADSESVEDLIEEGNAFEADVVAGVEHADEDQEREVHTHEVPEDDVPEEYLDKE
jgi:hypothetical protein